MRNLFSGFLGKSSSTSTPNLRSDDRYSDPSATHSPSFGHVYDPAAAAASPPLASSSSSTKSKRGGRFTTLRGKKSRELAQNGTAADAPPLPPFSPGAGGSSTYGQGPGYPSTNGGTSRFDPYNTYAGPPLIAPSFAALGSGRPATSPSHSQSRRTQSTPLSSSVRSAGLGSNTALPLNPTLPASVSFASNNVPSPPAQKTTAKTLAERLNELAIAHGDGLLDNEEYRLLRQNIFDRLAKGETQMPQETSIGSLPGSSSKGPDASNVATTSLPPQQTAPSCRSPSIKSGRSSVTGVSAIWRRSGGGKAVSVVSGGSGGSGAGTSRHGRGSSGQSKAKGAGPVQTSSASMFSNESAKPKSMLSRKASVGSAAGIGGASVGGGRRGRAGSRSGSIAGSSVQEVIGTTTGASSSVHNFSSSGRSMRSIRTNASAATASSARSHAPAYADPTSAADDARSAADIRAEIKEVQLEGKKLVEAFDGLENAAIRRARLDPDQLDALLAADPDLVGGSEADVASLANAAVCSPTTATASGRSGSGRSGPDLLGWMTRRRSSIDGDTLSGGGDGDGVAASVNDRAGGGGGFARRLSMRKRSSSHTGLHDAASLDKISPRRGSGAGHGRSTLTAPPPSSYRGPPSPRASSTGGQGSALGTGAPTSAAAGPAAAHSRSMSSQKRQSVELDEQGRPILPMNGMTTTNGDRLHAANGAANEAAALGDPEVKRLRKELESLRDRRKAVSKRYEERIGLLKAKERSARIREGLATMNGLRSLA